MPTLVAARFPRLARLALTWITINRGRARGLLHGCNLPPHRYPQPVGNFAAVTHDSPRHPQLRAGTLRSLRPARATLGSDLAPPTSMRQLPAVMPQVLA